MCCRRLYVCRGSQQRANNATTMNSILITWNFALVQPTVILILQYDNVAWISRNSVVLCNFNEKFARNLQNVMFWSVYFFLCNGQQVFQTICHFLRWGNVTHLIEFFFLVICVFEKMFFGKYYKIVFLRNANFVFNHERSHEK